MRTRCPPVTSQPHPVRECAAGTGEPTGRKLQRCNRKRRPRRRKPSGGCAAPRSVCLSIWISAVWGAGISVSSTAHITRRTPSLIGRLASGERSPPSPAWLTSAGRCDVARMFHVKRTAASWDAGISLTPPLHQLRDAYARGSARCIPRRRRALAKASTAGRVGHRNRGFVSPSPAPLVRAATPSPPRGRSTHRHRVASGEEAVASRAPSRWHGSWWRAERGAPTRARSRPAGSAAQPRRQSGVTSANSHVPVGERG